MLQFKDTIKANIDGNATTATTATTADKTKAALTIQKNGTQVGSTFNGSTATTINVTVPTKLSELTNDGNYVKTTTYASATTGGVIKLGTGLTIKDGIVSVTGSATADSVEWAAVKNAPTKVSYWTNDSGYLTVANTMTGATATTAGAAGVVPAPASGAQAKYLRGDGQWATVAEATKATQDGSGNTITSTYVKKSGDTMTGALAFSPSIYAGTNSPLISFDASGRIGAGGNNDCIGIYGNKYLYLGLGTTTTTRIALDSGENTLTPDSGTWNLGKSANRWNVIYGTRLNLGNSTQAAIGEGGIHVHDVRNAEPLPTSFGNQAANFFFHQLTTGGDWYSFLHVKGWNGDTYQAWELGGPATNNASVTALKYRVGQGTTWQAWKTIAFTDSNITGNAATATKATQDGDGNVITSTYVKKAGDTMTGALNFKNATYNKFGDDVEVGDKDVAGTLCLHGLNGATGIQFNPYSGSVSQKISIDGSGSMTITENVRVNKVIKSVQGDVYLTDNFDLHYNTTDKCVEFNFI